jgi:hypothetical protein
VKYQNPASPGTNGTATIKSASLTYTDATGSKAIPFAVIPTDSGIVTGGESVTVNHRKDPNSQTGLGCTCSPAPTVTLNVTWATGGESVTESFGPTTLECSF